MMAPVKRGVVVGVARQMETTFYLSRETHCCGNTSPSDQPHLPTPTFPITHLTFIQVFDELMQVIVKSAVIHTHLGIL